MSTLESTGEGRELLLQELRGEDCEWCEDGTLERDTYKDTRGLVCGECGTPGVRLF